MSSDKEYYDSHADEDVNWDWVTAIAKFVEPWSRDQEIFHSYGMKVLELGAGSCTTSSIISRKVNVVEIVACDISSRRMSNMAQRVCDNVSGNFDKLRFVEADFNQPLPFGDDEFDIVIMDAALHHSRNLWVTLPEIRRVLKANGTFVAQREAYTSPLTHWITFKRILASPEAAAQVSENAYLKSQYDYYLRVNGFNPKFYPIYPNLKFRALWFLNGIVYSKYNIVAKLA